MMTIKAKRSDTERLMKHDQEHNDNTLDLFLADLAHEQLGDKVKGDGLIAPTEILNDGNMLLKFDINGPIKVIIEA